MKPENYQKISELMTLVSHREWQLQRMQKIKDFKLVFDTGGCSNVFSDNVNIGDNSTYGKIANNAFKAYKKAIQQELEELRKELAKL